MVKLALPSSREGRSFFEMPCWCRAMRFRLRAGFAAEPCAFRWLAVGSLTVLRREEAMFACFNISNRANVYNIDI